MRLGSLLVEGRLFPITSIRLADGVIEFVANGFGPLPTLDSAAVTLIDVDGNGVGQVPEGLTLEIPARPSDTVTIVVRSKIFTMESLS